MIGLATQACRNLQLEHRELAPAERMPSAQISVSSQVSLKSEKANLTLPSGSTANNISGSQALKWLEHGNQRYAHQIARADADREVDRRIESAARQHPHAVVISCSDSVVPPEIIFDQKIGEIYVVRTAGEELDGAGVASVEFAVRKFGIQLIYVLGHNHCETIEESLHYMPTLTTTSPTLDALLAHVREKIFVGDEDGDSTLNFQPGDRARRGIAAADGHVSEALVQALGVARDLEAHSSLIQQRIANDSLLIKTGVYRAETGRVKTQ